jgi:hypothetical protein
MYFGHSACSQWVHGSCFYNGIPSYSSFSFHFQGRYFVRGCDYILSLRRAKHSYHIGGSGCECRGHCFGMSAG